MGNEALLCKWNSFWITTFYSTCVYRRDNSLLEKPLLSPGMRGFMGIVVEDSKSYSVHAQIASILKTKWDEWFTSEAKGKILLQVSLATLTPFHSKIKRLLIYQYQRTVLSWANTDSWENTVNQSPVRHQFEKRTKKKGFSSRPSYNNMRLRWGLIIQSYKERESTVFPACWRNIKHSPPVYASVQHPMKPVKSLDWLNKTHWKFLPTSHRHTVTSNRHLQSQTHAPIIRRCSNMLLQLKTLRKVGHAFFRSRRKNKTKMNLKGPIS